jgi:hypothetical protein
LGRLLRHDSRGAWRREVRHNGRSSTVRRESGRGRALLNRGGVRWRKAKMAEGSGRGIQARRGGGGCPSDNRTRERRSQVTEGRRGSADKGGVLGGPVRWCVGCARRTWVRQGRREMGRARNSVGLRWQIDSKSKF